MSRSADPEIDSRQMLARMLGQQEPNVAAEIAGLRAEVAALREALVPSTSTIVTGRGVVEAFKQLQRKRP